METLLLSSQAAGVGEEGTEILGSWSLDPGCNRAAAGALEARAPVSTGLCCKGKMHTGFQRFCLGKKTAEYLMITVY